MSLSVEYESLDEAQMRLSGTVVLYGGVPVYITSVNTVKAGDPKPDVFRVYASPLPYQENMGDNEEMRKFISSKKFDLKTIKLGFINIDDTIVYACREPRRQYKQGLSRDTLSVTRFNGEAARGRAAAEYSLTRLITRQEFVDTILGKYPSFEEAIKQVSGGKTKAVAFSREYAVVSDDALEGLIFLYHKMNKVGFIMDGQVKLPKNMAFLKEALLEVGLRI